MEKSYSAFAQSLTDPIRSIVRRRADSATDIAAHNIAAKLAKICFVVMLVTSSAAAQTATPMIEIGSLHSLALKSDGSVWAWGQDYRGELGQARLLQSDVPVQVAGLQNIAQISSGNGYSLALSSDGTVWAWGANFYGELGDGTKENRSEPVQVKDLQDAIGVSAGSAISLALKNDGSVWGWGWVTEAGSEIGIRMIAGLDNVKAVAAGSFYGLALKHDGTVWAWGFNRSGVLGDGSTTDRWSPAPVLGLSDVVAIAASSAFSHNLALKSDGTVWAWGEDIYGALGLPGNTEYCDEGNRTPVPLCSRVPRRVSNLANVVAIAAGFGGVSLALINDGTVWAWGWGIGSTPTRILGVSNATAIAYANGFGMAIDQAGTIFSWRGSQAQPALVLSGVLTVDGNFDFATALKADGTVWAWGSNRYGQLGIGQITHSATPLRVTGLTNVKSVATAVRNNMLASGSHNLALKADGTVWAWGMNFSGQLGDGTRIDRSTPVQVLGLTDVMAITAGLDTSFAVKNDGTVWGWGWNGNGDLADGTTISRNTPVQVQGLGNIASVSSEGQYVLALKQDGTVWAWGWNGSGQLGDGTTTTRYTPMQVAGISQVVKVVAGVESSYAIRSDGTLWAWGSNYYGQLGTNTADSCSGRVCSKSPTQIPAFSDVIDIAAGWYHAVAVRAGGSVWTWGYNANGQLGDGTTTHRSSPSPVPGFAEGITVAAGLLQTFAVKRDGTTWSWGWNRNAQLGDGTYETRRQPVLVVNELFNGPLDLIPEVPNNIPPDKIPPFFLATYKSGDLSATSLSADVRGITPIGSLASAIGVGPLAAGNYNVYVAATVPYSGSLLFYQLDPTNRWSALTWPMADFMRGVALGSQDALVRVNILQNVDLSPYVGASILVGYGTDPDEMVANARYRTIFTVTEPVNAP